MRRHKHKDSHKTSQSIIRPTPIIFYTWARLGLSNWPRPHESICPVERSTPANLSTCVILARNPKLGVLYESSHAHEALRRLYHIHQEVVTATDGGYWHWLAPVPTHVWLDLSWDYSYLISASRCFWQEQGSNRIRLELTRNSTQKFRH